MSSAFLVDVALAPIGLLVAFVAVDHPVALTFVLPLIGLLVIFARERQVRIDHALELSHAYRGTALSSATSWRPTTRTPAVTAAMS